MTIPTENADFLVGDDNFNFINGLGGDDLIFGKGAVLDVDVSIRGRATARVTIPTRASA